MGVAMLVPLRTCQGPLPHSADELSLHAPTSLTPGAKMSTHLPTLLKLARASM